MARAVIETAKQIAGAHPHFARKRPERCGSRRTGLTEGVNLRLDLGQSGFKGGAAAWIRGPLRQDVFALQVERLFLAFPCGALKFGGAPLVLC